MFRGSSFHTIDSKGRVIIPSRFRDLLRAGGGDRVAKMVGARPIDPDTRDSDERKLRNIVEEMAIASGVPVPDLYIMDRETGINAFGFCIELPATAQLLQKRFGLFS